MLHKGLYHRTGAGFFFFSKRGPSSSTVRRANPQTKRFWAMKILFQRFLFVLTITTPHLLFFLLHRTRCSPLFYLSSLVFGSWQFDCTTRHSYLFISAVPFPRFSHVNVYPSPPHRPQPSPHHGVFICLFVPMLYVTEGPKKQKIFMRIHRLQLGSCSGALPIGELSSHPCCTNVCTSRYLGFDYRDIGRVRKTGRKDRNGRQDRK